MRKSDDIMTRIAAHVYLGALSLLNYYIEPAEPISPPPTPAPLPQTQPQEVQSTPPDPYTILSTPGYKLQDIAYTEMPTTTELPNTATATETPLTSTITEAPITTTTAEASIPSTTTTEAPTTTTTTEAPTTSIPITETPTTTATVETPTAAVTTETPATETPTTTEATTTTTTTPETPADTTAITTEAAEVEPMTPLVDYRFLLAQEAEREGKAEELNILQFGYDGKDGQSAPSTSGSNTVLGEIFGTFWPYLPMCILLLLAIASIMIYVMHKKKNTTHDFYPDLDSSGVPNLEVVI